MSASVDVWVASVDPAADGRAAAGAAERARASRFASDDSRRRWLAGRAVLRRVLGAVLGVAPEAVDLHEEPGGRLVLSTDVGVHFSLSRAADLVVVAVADRPVGVDVEVDRRLVRPGRLADRLIEDPAERRRWESSEEPERTRTLLQRWTRVEAMLKGTGDGLGGGVAGAPARLTAAGWVVRDVDLGRGPGVMAAVAARGGDWVAGVPRAAPPPGPGPPRSRP